MDNNESYKIPIQEEESFDLRKWIGKILSNWYWFVLTVAIFGGGSWIYTKYLVRTYKVQATMMIKTQKGAVGAEALYNTLNLSSGPSFPDNEIQVLKSWSLARRTLEELDFEISHVAVGKWSEAPLYQNVPFRVVLGPNALSYAGVPIYVKMLDDDIYQLKINGRYDVDTTMNFGKAFVHKNFNFVLNSNPNFNIYTIPEVVRSDEYYFKVNNLDHLAYHYKNKLSASWAGTEGSIVVLSTTGFSSQMEVDYINALMKEYIQKNLDEKNATAKNTIDFIDQQLAGIEDTLKRAEDNLTQFRSQNTTLSLSSEAKGYYDRMDKLAQEKNLIDYNVNYYRSLMDYLSDTSAFTDGTAPISMGVTDPTIVGLITVLKEKMAEQARIKYSATDKFRSTEKINLEVDAAREELKFAVNSFLKTALETQENNKRRTNQLNFEMRQLPEIQAQLLQKENRFNMAQGIHTFLSQKRAEAAIAQASNTPDQRIIDEARTDGVVKVSPDNYRNYTMGVVIGLLLPLLLIILREITNTTIREKEDVEKRTKIPIVGSVGHNRRDHNLPVIKYGRSSIAESFRAIRTDLQFILFKDNKKVIMVTSTIAKEGKSFVSLNLGGIFSLAGKKAVVVGLDLRKPVLHKELNLPNIQGVTTFIIGKSKMEDILIKSEYDNLWFIPSGPVAPNPAELIETPEFEAFLEDLKANFDIIILDTPPVALVTDASLIAKHSDAVLYVVRQNHTLKSSLPFIEKLNDKGHIKNLNIIINDVVVPKYYGYKYGYGYGYGYGKGYGSGYYEEK